MKHFFGGGFIKGFVSRFQFIGGFFFSGLEFFYDFAGRGRGGAVPDSGAARCFYSFFGGFMLSQVYLLFPLTIFFNYLHHNTVA